MSRRTLWWAVALLTGVVVALISAVGILGSLARQSFAGSDLYVMPVTQLAVNSSSGSITVVPGPAGRVTVTQNLHWATTRPAVAVDRRGGAITVSVDCGGYGMVSAWDCSADVTIQVPPQTSVLTVDESGTTAVQRLSGPLDLQTASGSLELDAVSGPVQALVDSGSVEGDSLRSSTVAVQADSGSIDLGFSTPPKGVQTRVGSGSIDVAVPQGSHYRVTGGASSGGSWDVAEGLNTPSATGTIYATSGSGSVDIDYSSR